MKYIDADQIRADSRPIPRCGIGRHFFMFEKMNKEQPVDEMEEEMDRYFESMEVQEYENIFEDTFHKIARHFAEWGATHLKR